MEESSIDDSYRSGVELEEIDDEENSEEDGEGSSGEGDEEGEDENDVELGADGLPPIPANLVKPVSTNAPVMRIPPSVTMLRRFRKKRLKILVARGIDPTDRELVPIPDYDTDLTPQEQKEITNFIDTPSLPLFQKISGLTGPEKEFFQSFDRNNGVEDTIRRPRMSQHAMDLLDKRRSKWEKIRKTATSKTDSMLYLGVEIVYRLSSELVTAAFELINEALEEIKGGHYSGIRDRDPDGYNGGVPRLVPNIEEVLMATMQPYLSTGIGAVKNAEIIGDLAQLAKVIVEYCHWMKRPGEEVHLWMLTVEDAAGALDTWLDSDDNEIPLIEWFDQQWELMLETHGIGSRDDDDDSMSWDEDVFEHSEVFDASEESEDDEKKTVALGSKKKKKKKKENISKHVAINLPINWHYVLLNGWLDAMRVNNWERARELQVAYVVAAEDNFYVQVVSMTMERAIAVASQNMTTGAEVNAIITKAAGATLIGVGGVSLRTRETLEQFDKYIEALAAPLKNQTETTDPTARRRAAYVMTPSAPLPTDPAPPAAAPQLLPAAAPEVKKRLKPVPTPLAPPPAPLPLSPQLQPAAVPEARKRLTLVPTPLVRPPSPPPPVFWPVETPLAPEEKKETTKKKTVDPGPARSPQLPIKPARGVKRASEPNAEKSDANESTSKKPRLDPNSQKKKSITSSSSSVTTGSSPASANPRSTQIVSVPTPLPSRNTPPPTTGYSWDEDVMQLTGGGDASEDPNDGFLFL